MRVDISNGFVCLVAENPAEGLLLGCLSNRLRIEVEVAGEDARLPIKLPAVEIQPSKLTWRKEPPDCDGIWLRGEKNGTVIAWQIPSEHPTTVAGDLWAGPIRIEGKE